MFVAFSPEQLYDVSRAFDSPLEAMIEALCAEHFHKCQDGKEEEKKPPATSTNTTSTAPVEAKHTSETPPENHKQTCCPRNNIKKKLVFHRGLVNNHKKPARTRTIEQRSPIHMHEETPEAARMSLDVTGFATEDISITVENYVVYIRAQRTNKLGDVFVLDRKFRLDKNTANMDSVTATFEDGILELTVPKKSPAGPRTIPIVVGSPTNSEEENPPTDDETSASREESNLPVGSAEEEEDLQSMEETSSEKDQEPMEDGIVQEDKGTIIEHEANGTKDKTTPETIHITTKSVEDEAWEEVSE